MTICHMEKFLHMTDFSQQAPLVMLVTNIRYADTRYQIPASYISSYHKLYSKQAIQRFFTLEYCWWFVSVFKALIEIYHNITMWQIDQKISSRIEGLNVRIHLTIWVSVSQERPLTPIDH